VIAGVGIDLVPVGSLNDQTRTKLFTAAEQEEAGASPRPEEAFAGKFAIKEALMKAMGAGIRQGVWFPQIEVLHHSSGAPSVRAVGEAGRRLEALGAVVHASLTHSEGWAVAVVMLENERHGFRALASPLAAERGEVATPSHHGIQSIVTAAGYAWRVLVEAASHAIELTSPELATRPHDDPTDATQSASSNVTHDATAIVWTVVVVVVFATMITATYVMVRPVFDWPRHSLSRGL
jgi:holo-[acyl-carrier protein] synthase